MYRSLFIEEKCYLYDASTGEINIMPSLSIQLLESISDLDDSNPKWVMFIKDHYDLLLFNSTVYELTPDKMNIFKYRPRDLMVDLNLNPDITWVVLYLNNLQDVSDFVGIESLHIPSLDYINTLRTRFETYDTTTPELVTV